MKTKILDITIGHLDQYMCYIREETKLPKTNIYEYIEKKHKEFNIKEGEKFTAQIRDINFSEKENKIDLSYANLSGVTFKNINFSGLNTIIKGANLAGCELKNTYFTDMIDLDGTNFGPITLDREVFKRAQLEKAIYDPTNSENMLFPLTQKEIDEYLASDPRRNLNAYLTEKLKHVYPERKIIADLSGHTIDERFSNSDISGSNLTNATITGNITQLKMRDCTTHNTLFKNCTLTEPDLRGTALINKRELLTTPFNASIFQGKVDFIDGKFSINGNNITTEDGNLLPHQNQAVFSQQGSTYDPCYNKAQPDNKRTPIKCTREDIQKYIDNVSKYKDFISFIKDEKNLQDADIIADFSGQDLSEVNFSGGIFKNCDFSSATINGCKFNNSIMENCNFSRAKSSRSFVGDAYPVAYSIGQYFRERFGGKDTPIEMNGAVFKNCDLTLADLTRASGIRVEFDQVTAIGLNAPNLTLGASSKITNSNFRGVNLNNLQGAGLEIDNSDFTQANFRPAFVQSVGTATVNLISSTVNLSKKLIPVMPAAPSLTQAATILSGAKITRSNFNHADLTQVQLEKATFQQCSTNKDTDFAAAILNGATLSQSKLHGNVRANWQSWLSRSDNTTGDKETDFSNADFQLDHLKGDIDTSGAIESIKSYEVMKTSAQEQIDNNKQKVYDRYAKVLLGLSLVLVVASLIAPPLLGISLPIMVTLAMPIIQSALLVVSSFVGFEMINKNYARDDSSSFVRPIANFLGAAKVIEKLNIPYETKKQSCVEKIEKLESNGREIKRIEPDIITHSKNIDKCMSNGMKAKEARINVKKIQQTHQQRLDAEKNAHHAARLH